MMIDNVEPRMFTEKGFLTVSQLREARRKFLLSEAEKHPRLAELLRQTDDVTLEQIEEALKLEKGRGC